MNIERIVFKEEQILGGEKIKTIELREPTVKDVRLCSAYDNEMEQQNQLIRLLSGHDTITSEEFDAMPWKEYKKLSEAIEGFL